MWAFIGGIGGLLRMIAAAAMVAVAIIAYFVWIIIPREREDARSGYVQLTRAETAENEVWFLKQQLGATQTVIDAYQEQYRNSLEKLAQADAEDEARIADYEAKLKAAGAFDDLTADDVDFILRKRSATTETKR